MYILTNICAYLYIFTNICICTHKCIRDHVPMSVFVMTWQQEGVRWPKAGKWCWVGLCAEYEVDKYLNLPQVQEALNVANFEGRWYDCSDTLDYSREDLLAR